MALKIRTVMTYPLNGSTVDFMIPFEYLARKFVTVTLIGTERKELVLNQDYRFTAKNQVTTTRAWGSNDGFSLIEVRRYTSATERLVDFADGSILRAYDLNISQVQTLHVAEEARDLTADTIGVNNDGHLDARGRRIVNVADPIGDFDALNLRTVKVWNDSAYQSQIKAKESEDKAKFSEVSAYKWAENPENVPVVGAEFSSKHYSRKAGKFKEAAAASQTAASRSEGNANTSEGNAASSASKALVSEGNSKTSENNAWTSWDNAQKEANRSRDEADRAKREADKLGNMNQLSEAIESVTPPTANTTGKVVWKYEVDAKDINGSWIRSTGDLVADETLYVHGGNYIIKDKWVQTGANKQTNLIRGSIGGFTCDDYFVEIVGHYLERGWHIGGGGNDTWMRHHGDGTFLLNSNQGSRILLNDGALLEQDGNLRGAIWDGKWLKDFMEERYLVNIWIGAGRTRHVGQQTWEGWIDNGCVMRGIKQVRAGSDCFIEELYFNELWKSTARGQWII